MACRDGQKYANSYSYDEATDKVSGCPARAPSVDAIREAVKTRSGVKGAAASRQHAEALSLEELQKLMRWSEKECPHEMVTPERAQTARDLEELQVLTKHGLMRAFSSSAFTLWTR